MNRRNLITGSASAVAVLATGAAALWRSLPAQARTGSVEVTKSEAEWRALLSDAQYHILRGHGTERAGTSPLNGEKRKGLFHCAGCDLAAYSSEVKYDSGTGWPSFWEALPGAVGTSEDNSLFMTRTEVHCSRCGGHFGHIFDDGPPPTGKRHCINGLALTFRPATA